MSSRVNDKHIKALLGSGEIVHLTIKIDKILHKKFHAKAVSEDTTMTEIITKYITAYIKQGNPDGGGL